MSERVRACARACAVRACVRAYVRATCVRRACACVRRVIYGEINYCSWGNTVMFFGNFSKYIFFFTSFFDRNRS